MGFGDLIRNKALAHDYENRPKWMSTKDWTDLHTSRLKKGQGGMTILWFVKSVLLKDGRTIESRDDSERVVLYDSGVQRENDNGATLYGWTEIASVTFF